MLPLFRKQFTVLGLVALLGVGVSVLLLQGQQAGNKAGADWPVVRGNPLQSGVTGTTLPDKLEVLWTFKAKDAFEGAAAIVDGVVYVGNFDEHLYALDLKTGQEKWHYKLGSTKAAPGVSKGAVYIGDEDGVMHCIDARTGQKRWTFETRGEIEATANFHGDRVLFGSYDGNLYCLSPEGKKLWTFKMEAPVNGSPAVVGDRTFVAGCDGSLHVIDLKTGKEVSSLELGGQSAATAAVRGNHLYVGTMSNQVLGIDWQANKVDWVFEPKKRAQPFFGSAAVTDKLVVVGGRDRNVYGLKRTDGTEVWSFRTGGKVDASPVIASQRVYAPSGDGWLYVLDLNSGKEVQKLQLGQFITASPAVAEGRLVVGTTDGVLYCLGSK